MNVKVLKDAALIGKAAGTVFVAQVLTKPNSVLGLATGSSPLYTYQEMIRCYQNGLVDYSAVTTFNLDEYIGLGHEHDQSYYYFMQENLFNGINVPTENIHVLSGTNPDIEGECAAYEKAIKQAGGIDLQILGIGNNGHIAFNEPTDHFPETCHAVQLTQSTIEANKRFFSSIDDVPRSSVTMGIGSIFKAKKIVLIATGTAKAEAVYQLVNGRIDPRNPSSILKLHPDVTVFADPAAASLL